jgi:pilus assembly protein CpaE
VIILLENDELTASSIRGVLHGPTETIGTTVEIRRRLDRAVPHTIVLGPTVPDSAALELARSVRVSHPSVGVIVIRTRLDAATLTAVMRSGARDAIAAHELDKLAERVAASEATSRAIRGEEATSGEGERSASIVTVFSPKGGCGKTTIATNLSCVFAAEGRRVVLLDFDLAFGDVAIAMGLQTNHSIGEAIDISDRLDPAAFEGMLTKHRSGVHVLAAPANPADVERITPALLERIIDLAASMFDVVVIDTAPALDERNLTILESADRVCVVTTLDVAAIKNVKVSLETLRMLSFPLDGIDVVLNRADAKVGLDPDQVADLLKAEITIRVPSSRDVPDSTNHGSVLSDAKPKHPVSSAIRALASAEVDAQPVAEAEKVSVRSRRGLRRLRRSA